MRYANFCVKKLYKNNAKIARFRWTRKSRDSCPTSSDGAPFTLYTDHKPSALIYANPVAKPAARIERWLLRLEQYDFEIVC